MQIERCIILSICTSPYISNIIISERRNTLDVVSSDHKDTNEYLFYNHVINDYINCHILWLSNNLICKNSVLRGNSLFIQYKILRVQSTLLK